MFLNENGKSVNVEVFINNTALISNCIFKRESYKFKTTILYLSKLRQSG